MFVRTSAADVHTHWLVCAKLVTVTSNSVSHKQMSMYVLYCQSIDPVFFYRSM